MRAGVAASCASSERMRCSAAPCRSELKTQQSRSHLLKQLRITCSADLGGDARRGGRKLRFERTDALLRSPLQIGAQDSAKSIASAEATEDYLQCGPRW